MPKDLIKFGNISKRFTSRNSKSKTNNFINECNSIEKSYRTINNVLDNKSGGMNIIKINTDKLLESLTDSTLADKYTYYPISVAEKIRSIDESYSNYIINRYCSMVLPYVGNIAGIIECIDSYNLSDSQKNTILKEANTYNICDRILNNHNTISKRFNLEDIVLKYKYNPQVAIESVCGIIDTYNREPYQKMNICLEELFYLFEKNNIKYNKSNALNTIVEYFLISTEDLSNRNYNGIKKCITESSVITEDEANSIIYLSTNRDDNTNSNIRQILSSYYTAAVKNKEALLQTIVDAMNSDTIDIVYNFKFVLDFILTVYKFDRILDSELEVVMSDAESIISSKLVSVINNAEISRDDLSNIILTIISTIKQLESMFLLDNVQPRIKELYNHLKNILAIITPYYDNIYSSDNIKTINQLESCNIEIPLSEGQLFKAHNLFNAIRNLDRYLGDKCKKAINHVIGKGTDNNPTIRDKVNKILFKDDKKGSLFDQAVKKSAKNVKNVVSTIGDAIKAAIVKESYNPYEYLSEETKMFDIILADINFKEDELSDIHDQIASICKEFNYILESSRDTDNCKLYYIINTNNISLHLSENRKFILDNDNIKAIREATHRDINNALLKLVEAEETANFIDSIDNKDIESSLFSYFTKGDMSINKFDTILEALSLLEVDKSIIEKFANKYLDHKYYSLSEDIDIDSESKIVYNLVNEYTIEENVPDDIKLEAYLLVDSLLEVYTDDDFDDDDDYEPNKKQGTYSSIPNDDEEDDNNDKSSSDKEDNNTSKDDMEDIRKNPYKGLNLKSMKLYIMGLKSKFKNMSQKEKELSKNVDAAFKHLVDSFKNAMISDSRESIIKGSVIPSFSKCLKIGIPAAIGIGTGLINPGVAAIAALGSFAMSKHLTKKERILLLDEIETELEVVDKEISMAEREEDMKKYRALLQYKRNLQRQYQRIKYNVKMGKDILPGSNVGISGDKNNGY